MIQNEIILDSIGQYSPRLTTMRAIAPTMIHQETLRHRKIYIHDALAMDPDFSFSVSSTRAIPFHRTLNDVINNPAKPVRWGAEQKGMVPGDNLTEPFMCPDGVMRTPDDAWQQIAQMNAAWAQAFSDAGHHKSTCNRIISTYNHTHCLMTATETGWMNFFGLRLDNAADPTLRALAELQWKHYNENKPNKLEPGQWHLPFVADLESCEDIRSYYDNCSGNWGGTELDLSILISVARCARLSYNSFETNKRSTIEEDLKLYYRLIGSTPIHASPAEHQATPDILLRSSPRFMKDEGEIIGWQKPKLSGNLGPGWIQYRKMLPNEAVAPLPKEYTNG